YFPSAAVYNGRVRDVGQPGNGGAAESSCAPVIVDETDLAAVVARYDIPVPEIQNWACQLATGIHSHRPDEGGRPVEHPTELRERAAIIAGVKHVIRVVGERR